jgi:hypothetical protein
MNGYEYITFLRRLNTLSTRGKKAAIFLSD